MSLAPARFCFSFSSSLFFFVGGGRREGVGCMVHDGWCEMERWMFDRGERGEGKRKRERMGGEMR